MAGTAATVDGWMSWRSTIEPGRVFASTRDATVAASRSRQSAGSTSQRTSGSPRVLVVALNAPYGGRSSVAETPSAFNASAVRDTSPLCSLAPSRLRSRSRARGRRRR